MKKNDPYYEIDKLIAAKEAEIAEAHKGTDLFCVNGRLFEELRILQAERDIILKRELEKVRNGLSGNNRS